MVPRFNLRFLAVLREVKCFKIFKITMSYNKMRRLNDLSLMWIGKVLRGIEMCAAYSQGKGYGTGTIAQEVKLVSSIIASNPETIIDIGGNLGHYTAALRAMYARANIHVFEPSPLNVNRLRSRFSGDHRIKVVASAVSHFKGESDLHFDEPGSGMGSLSKRRLDHFKIDFKGIERVGVIRFEDYWISELKRGPVELVKLDIEGHEYDALKGFGSAIRSVGAIQFEFGGANIDSKTYFQDYYYYFRDNGFRIYRISPFGLCVVDRYSEWDETFLTTNFLAENLNFEAYH